MHIMLHLVHSPEVEALSNTESVILQVTSIRDYWGKKEVRT